VRIPGVGVLLCIFSILFVHLHSLALREPKVEVYLSAISNTQYHSILNFFEVEEEKMAEIEVEPTENELIKKGFTWGPGKEDSQMDACLNWLNQIISIPARKVMLSVVNKKGLLNYFAGNLMLKGTTDIVILLQNYKDGLILRRGIQIVIKLKKEAVNEADRHQAAAQLLSASAFFNYPVVVILTNLNKYWLFMWLSESGIEQALLGPCYALTAIKNLLNEEKACPLGGRYTMKEYIAERRGVKATQDSESPAAAGQRALDELISGKKVDPYDLVPKPEAGNMEDFFDEMSEEEIAQYKFTHFMNCWTSTPAWQTMYA
jgi:hypothetical protein